MPCTLILVRHCASVNSYGFRRQNEKRGNEGRIREVHPKKREKKKKSTPRHRLQLFVCLFSFYADASEENHLKISNPEMTDIHFYIHVKAFLIALFAGLPLGLEAGDMNFLFCTLHRGELVDRGLANLQTSEMSKHFLFLHCDQRIL